MRIDDFLDDDGMFLDGEPMPASLGAVVDLYHAAKELRLAMEKQVEGGIKKLETALQEHLISKLSKSDTTGVAGHRYRAQVIPETVYTVDTSPDANGWEKIHAWIAKNNRFDLLQKRLGEKAVKDWHEEHPDERLPGIQRMQVPKLSVRKI